jgi:hypothetical protein
MQQEQSIPGVANILNDIRASITSEFCDQLDILDRYFRRGPVWQCKMNVPHRLSHGGDNEKHQSSAVSPVTTQVPSRSTSAALKSAYDVCVCDQASDTLSLNARTSTSLGSPIHRDIEYQ